MVGNIHHSIGAGFSRYYIFVEFKGNILLEKDTLII